MAIKVWVFPMPTRDIMNRLKKNDGRDGKYHVFFVIFNMLKNSVLYHLKINPFYLFGLQSAMKYKTKCSSISYTLVHQVLINGNDLISIKLNNHSLDIPRYRFKVTRVSKIYFRKYFTNLCNK